jgi:ribose 1,5-bisphosphokinase
LHKQLIYVVGASGSGKDSLMRMAREELSGHRHIVFAHRYITRKASDSNENHIELSEREFFARKAMGLFAMCWESHNNRYGIGIEINQWLSKGCTVVLNGSREYLLQAKERYPELLSVCIDVPHQVLERRLIDRQRESTQEIQARLHRNLVLKKASPVDVTLNNEGTIEEGGSALSKLILNHSGVTSCV